MFGKPLNLKIVCPKLHLTVRLKHVNNFADKGVITLILVAGGITGLIAMGTLCWVADKNQTELYSSRTEHGI